MKFSENWLRTLVDIPVGRDELVQRLTMSGLEVEDVVVLGAALDGVVVGEIIAAEKHPDADKLKVCQVDIGQGVALQIVCGASNARVGLKAPLATVGTKIGAISIKATKLRGVDSNGMLCSGRELGFDSDAEGLFELSGDAMAGQTLAECMGFPDATIELGLTPNRSDCLGMHGLAREVAAQFAAALHIIEKPGVTTAIEDTFPIRVDEPADCPRFYGRLIRGLDARAPTPQWIKDRLRRSGVRPISVLVDVANYVMIETGQPLHAFDAARLTSPVVVRRAMPNEKLKLLDGRTVELDEGFLVVADQEQAVGLAGIMGGYDSRVTDATVDIFLEAAHFSPTAISGRARRLGMHTDASHRFERGVDPQLPCQAIERASVLLLEIAGGRAGPLCEVVANEFLPVRRPVILRRDRLRRILGHVVADAEVTRILASLGMQVTPTAEGWTAIPPSARFDIAIEEDLIEEVARIHGYGMIPVQAPRGEITPAVVAEGRVSRMRMREHLAARDYCEAINYAFVDATLLKTWGLLERAVSLSNPLSAEMAVMRTSLLPGLVATLASNRKRQLSRVRLFEMGRSYHAAEGSPLEVDRIAGAASGEAWSEQWAEPRRKLDFFDIKGDAVSLLELAGLDASGFRFVAGGPEWLHPGRAATIWRGEAPAGYVGALNPRLQKALDLDDDVYVFELDIEQAARRSIPLARPVSRFPSVRRDIAVVLSDEIPYADVAHAVRTAVGERLVDLVLFDRYAGPNLGNGVKSLAMGLILQDRSRTLTDQDADQCVDLAVSALVTGYRAKLRG